MNGHDLGPPSDLHRPCRKCGYRMTLVAEMMASIGGVPIPPCPAKNPTHRGYDPATGKQYDIYDGKCSCDMKNLLSTGHDPGCPEKKRC